MTRPKLTDAPLWDNFAARALRVFRDALWLMIALPPETDELRLNRRLAALILDANRAIHLADGSGFDHLPSYDGHQLPLGPLDPPSDFERKRPDFTWSLIDHSAPSAQDGCREFVVECKRLGESPGSSAFNSLYVDRGVVRFVHNTHQYGLRGASGLMVGYVQTSDQHTILDAIGARGDAHGLPTLNPIGNLDAQVAELGHSLLREFGESPFNLTHLWVDLRPAA